MRSVGPTSIPWNDLYALSKDAYKGIFLPPIAISLTKSKQSYNYEACNGKKRKFLSSNYLNIFCFLNKLYHKNKKSNTTLIFHFHAPSLCLLGLFIKLFYRDIKIVFNMHSDWLHYKWYQKIGLKIFVHISDRYIAVSHAMLKRIPDKHKNKINKRGRLLYITNGIDVKKINSINKSSPWGYKNLNTAIVAARMVEAKNYPFILKLLKRTKAIDRLIWYGDGKLRNEIEMEITKLGLSDRIDLKGLRPREEVWDAFRNGTIYISASLWEGIGVANLEASALGCWPYLSRIPAHIEISKTLNINTYPLDNIDVWTSSINEYISLSKEEKINLNTQIKIRTGKNYDLSCAIVKYYKVYESL